MLKPTLFTVTLLHVSGLKGSSSESTDTFWEQNQHNTCQDMNIWLTSSRLYVSWHMQLPHATKHTTCFSLIWHLHLDMYFV